MGYFRLWRTSVYLTIVLQCLVPAVTQAVDECSPRCWNPVQENYGTYGSINHTDVENEEECKALCLNTESCIELDWNTKANTCWFLTMPSTIYSREGINHWSVAKNCTGDCAPFCWWNVKLDVHVVGGLNQSDISDENHCKLRCSNTLSCTGIDWNSNMRQCYLLSTANPSKNFPGIHHWDINRHLSTDCPSNATSSTVYRSTTSGSNSATVNTTSGTVDPLPSTTSLSEAVTRLTAGIIALAVLLGLCIVTIIGLAINTVRIERQLKMKSDVNCVLSSDNNYEGLQAVTRERVEDGTYTDLVQGNRKETVS